MLLIVVDTLRADHLGSYGYSRDTSPSVTALSQRGVIFDHAWSQFQETRPSHVSLMTGLYPRAHGILSNEHGPCRRSLLTWAEILAENGYATGAVVGNALLGREFLLDQGFGDYDDLMPSHELNRPLFGEKKAGDALAASLAWIEKHRDQRFFFWLHLQDPHGPYLPPESFHRAFAEDGKVVTGRLVEEQRIPKYQRIPGELRHDDYVARYDGEIAYADDAVGRLLGRLEELKISNRTLVVFTSDHGEGMGERGYYYLHHVPYVFEEVVRVPLIIAGPGVAPGRRCRARVELVDVVPTVLDLLGIPCPAAWKEFRQGRSFLHLLREPQGGSEAVVSEIGALSFTFGRENLSVLCTGKWKYISHPTAGARLYDLDKDPVENHSVLAQQQALAAEFEGLLKRRGEVDGKLNQSFGPPELWPSEVLERDRIRLEELGYAQAGTEEDSRR